MNERVLIVDDEKKMVRLIRTCLQKEGYLTCEAYDGEAALEVFDLEKPDIVVLDVMMPRLNGLEFCSRVRGRSTTPIIILSARSEEDDKLTGLDLGADDYLTKPFSMHELVARIRALLRRRKMLEHVERDVLAAGPLSIEADERRVTVGGDEVALTATEFEMLASMAAHPGRVYTRRELLEESRGDFFEGYERTVDAHVGNIRRKLGVPHAEWAFIETVHGVGYRFNAKKKA